MTVPARPIRRRSLVATASAIGGGILLAACSSSDGNGQSEEGVAGASDLGGSGGAWPRTIEHGLGTTELAAAPAAIVSTSVVLTGSLLAIDAPVIGSGASAPGGEGLDDQGFFIQWSDIADERGVQALYANSELDLEAVQAAAPDLILLSTVGGDSTAEAYDQLKAIAPTIAVDYNSTPWEEVTTTLGGIVGLEEQAAAVLEDYAAKIAEISAAITPPAEPVQAIVYNGENGSAFALPDGPHAELLGELGITVAPLPEGAEAEEGRGDVAFLSVEAAVAGLTAHDVLLISGDDTTAEVFRADPLLAAVPAVAGGNVVPLGFPSFKLDYYAALDMAEHVRVAYAK